MGDAPDRAPDCLWGHLKRFLRFLEKQPAPPREIGELRIWHLEGYRRTLAVTWNIHQVSRAVLDVCSMLAKVPREPLEQELLAYVTGPDHTAVGGRRPGKPGYSDREFAAIMAAARSDVAGIRDRIRHGEHLLKRYQSAAECLSEEERELGAHLVEIARTGAVPEAMVDGRGAMWGP